VQVDWLQVTMGLFGGLALFLGGLEALSDALRQAAGPALRTILARLTTNRFAAALTGAIVTGILNSSSVTTVLVVGFVTAGVMTLPQSVGVIMGANVGSTVTAQILAFNVSAYALAPIALGFFASFIARQDRIRQYGRMVMGLGLVFFGMGIMSNAMGPLRTYPPFVDALAGMERPLFAVLSGALFTALVQSSAATMGLAIALASEGLLGLRGGLGLALGANIGTCATALLAAIGKPPAAVRAAVVHLSFNILGAVLWLPFLSLLVALAAAVSPATPELEGAARVAAEVPRQLANANTIFNVVNTLLFLPFTGLFAWLAERLVKEKPLAVEARVEPRFLDDAALVSPDLALENARREAARLGEIARSMLDEFAAAVYDRDPEHQATIARRADEAASLQSAILLYLARLRKRAESEVASREAQDLVAIVFAFERLARLVSRDLAEIARQVEVLRPSADTGEMLKGLYDTASEAVSLAVRAVGEADALAAEEVIALRPRVDGHTRALLERQANHLRSDDPDYLPLARLQMSIVDKLGDAYDLAERVARLVAAPDEGRT
jgi:phosphate:Na+ symporter